ncbi:MAG: hypothetical protein ACI9EF_002779 [Pseudohongiellaceae bacterium]|jgi:hypothetical protein
MASGPVRIAMWSGPRNLSTALMRSFGSRSDTVVCDEPLYGHFLQATGKAHPMAETILEQAETHWPTVAAALIGPVPGGRAVSYQKHMAHHLLPHIGREWLSSLSHAFLLRRPRSMLSSLAAVWPKPTLEDTGLPQQIELLETLHLAEEPQPAVIDSDDLLANPEGMLKSLCRALQIPFDPAMLSWETGPRDTDGCWAPFWYASVERSTHFGPPRTNSAELPQHLEELCSQCDELYEQLAQHRLRAS